jgi:plastocyanin
MRFIAKLFLVAGLLSLIALSAASAADHIVLMNYDTGTMAAFFDPAFITIDPGDRIQWQNVSIVQHTSTSGLDCLPDGTWSSGIINPGASSAFITFNTPGTFDYYCRFHCLMGMTGEVVVNDLTGVGDARKSYHLEQNYPNPFNPTTTIRYTLPERSTVELAVFGVDGKLVRVLESGAKPMGTFEAKWDGHDTSGRAVASGVYYYRLKAGSFTETKKMVLMK